ncbi:MAG: zinc-dependent metalloprotease [Lacipirellulaceae bacterium]
MPRFALALPFAAVTSFALMLGPSAAPVAADEPAAPVAQAEATPPVAAQPAANSVAAEPEAKPATPPAAPAKPTEPPKYPPIEKVLKDTKKIDGLIKLHLSETTLFAELTPGDFDKDLIVLITIARGIGQTPVVGGFSWGFGDDWVWQFRKVGDQIQIVRRNVRFRAKAGTPTAEAVRLAYTDSVIFSLPILTRGGGGSYVVDLSPVFMSDLPQIGFALPGFSFNRQRSSWSDVRGYEKNVEVQIAATYSSSGYEELDSVPDSRGATINVHYSISRLPKTDYQPRLADDRVGYFLSVVKDFTEQEVDDRFVRYITRWNLQKADAAADVSTPKQPVKFWLEKTVPFKYRKPIRDGIEEWNKAFEKAGFYDAVAVEQQKESDNWEPGDINYNTFRWITAGAGFAMGPSRVNPLTGEILDADIIFDADFLQYWKQEYEFFTPKGIEVLTGGPIELDAYRKERSRRPGGLGVSHDSRCTCNLLGGVSNQLAFAAAVSAARKRSPEEMERLVTQALKEVAMHEVGHTLGLRHNFKASTFRKVADLEDTTKTSLTGVGASVMDYNPVNILPEGMKQGDYYSTTIGPYDYWAIEYGYKAVKDEKKDLAAIAARSGEPGLAFSTDEDTRGIDPDPHSRRFDMTDDLVAYARLQAKLVAEALPKVVTDLVEEGEGYERARRAFGVLLSTHGRVMFDATRYIGGVYVNRSHKGDAGAPKPFEVVDVARQRDALKLLEDEVLSDRPFSIPPSLYNELAPSRWDHWGVEVVERTDYPVHMVILMWQDRVLDQALGSLTLTRVHDTELKVPADQDALTTAELIERVANASFREVKDFKEGEYTTRKPAISSLRRNLQRSVLARLLRMALNQTFAPEDCATIAYQELSDLKESIDELLEDEPKLDPYSLAHLRETSARIEKALDSEVLLFP